MKPDNVVFENSLEKEYDVYSVAEKLVSQLAEKGMTVSTAESCTGGLIGAAITSVSGASAVFERGFVTYANIAKEEILGVPHETLEGFGAVSVQTAHYMAKGVCKAAKSRLGIAVTGIAGPTGGTPEKPVGLVYVGICFDGAVKVTEYHFSGDRNRVRTATVYMALCDAMTLYNATDKLEENF